ncbi:MAG: hypothetical protein V7603_5026 [Micromonosporaceae bacterium]
MTVTTTGTAPAGPGWVVANHRAGRLVSVLAVPDPAAALALASVVREFWPELEAKALAGPAAAALLDQTRGGGHGR